MAKMIKCPTCQTQIEVPAQATGQVVKCPGCGKGLKLVAKKKDPAAGGAGIQLTASGSPINPNSSVSGGSVSAMSFHGEPAPPDDLPNLDTNCQVCGRSTPFDELAEDNGKLVCGDCIKGARSSIARPAGGAEMVGFKAPEYRPSRRAKLINITPAFLAAAAIGLIWLGCQMYLSFNPKPIGKGVAMANAVKPKPGLISAKATTEPIATTAPAISTETHVATSQPVAVENPATPDTTQPAGAAPTSQAVAIAPQDNTIFTDPGKPGVPAPPAPELATADPIDRGIDRLQQGDFKAAKDAFEEARKKYVLGGRVTPNAPLTPQQTQVYNGLAASYIGLQKPDEAKVQFNILTAHTDKSRALVLNRGIAMLMETQIGPSEFNVAVPELKTYLEGASADDERAVDVFGSVLARLSAMPRVKRADMEALWTAWDASVDRLATATTATTPHPGQLKWGVEWMAAEQVQSFRKSRAVTTGLNPEQAGKNLQAAQGRKKAAQIALDTAKTLQAAGKPADPVGAQKRVDEAVKAEADAQRDFASVAAQATPPKWLDPKTQLQPVLP